jgi:hypothetical protein
MTTLTATFSHNSFTITAEIEENTNTNFVVMQDKGEYVKGYKNLSAEGARKTFNKFVTLINRNNNDEQD